jgi:hypothetical protein
MFEKKLKTRLMHTLLLSSHKNPSCNHQYCTLLIVPTPSYLILLACVFQLDLAALLQWSHLKCLFVHYAHRR